MGALQSLIDVPIDGYPTKSHRNSNCCCKSCGMQYDRSQCDSTMNRALLAHSHYLAELCGIWLGNPESGTHDTRQTLNKPTDVSPFGAFPSSTTLPKRSVSSSSKPSLIVSTLIKHTDFTKNERSALKHGFFSTTDMNMAGLSDCSGLAGCHIRGCLYVEHESLVFQAVDSSHRLPSVLTNRKEDSYDSHHAPTLPADRRRRTRASDPIAPTSTDPTECSHPASRSSSIPICACRKTHRRRLWTYFQDGRDPPRVGYSRSCRGCRKDVKSSDLWKTDDSKCTNSDCRSAYKKSVHQSGDSQRVPDSDGMDHDTVRLPPPPLRLSWPLCTLRRFGFYGNTLFKLEAGRRAPRGEGHYLFRIKALKDFRQYFEHFVHRRKSLSPPKSPTQHPVPAALLRLPSSTPFYPNEFEAHHQDEPSSMSTQLLHITPCHPRSTHNPPQEGLFQSSIPCSGHGLPFDTELDTVISPADMKQKANSLTHSSCHAAKISPTCLDWVRQQQQHHQQQRQNCFQNSCPHLSSSMFVMPVTKSRPFPCAESDADELISLPDPPPPPTSSGPMDSVDFQKIYDNVDLDWLNSATMDTVNASEPRSSDRATIQDSVTAGLSRDWLTSTSMSNPARGRLYTSRRAMTAFACSNLYPIPSRQHEEEEMEDDEDRETGRIDSDSARYVSPMPERLSTRRDSLHPASPIRSLDQTPVRTSVHITHLRHTSLPNPISDETFLVTCSTRAAGGGDVPFSQADPSDHAQSLGTDNDQPGNLASLVHEPRFDETPHLPYYNLSSPEALCHMVRTGSSSRSASMRTTLPPSDCTANSTLPVDSCPLRATTVGLSDHTTAWADSHCMDVCCGHPVPDSFSDSYAPTIHPHCRASTSSSSHPDALHSTEPFSSILHYATLDFSPPSPDRARLSVELGTVESDCTTECTTEHCVHDSIDPIDGRSTVCPMRVYGTFVHDPHLARNNLSATNEARVRSLSSSDPIRSASMGNTDNELPANYVAICQLQTLAMRAVLNATT